MEFAQRSQKLCNFYKTLFPSEQIYAWTQLGTKDPKEAEKREFCTTLVTPDNPDGIMIRYRDASNVEQFNRLFEANNDHYVDKLDIGPLYNQAVRDHKTSQLHAMQRELVFDIDMDDYNDVRTCCSDKTVCERCFLFLIAAAQVLNHILIESFGFSHILFVFSGRRGIHCWVSDPHARNLTSPQREAMAKYMRLTPTSNHPLALESYDIAKSFFPRLVAEQKYLYSADGRPLSPGTPEYVTKLHEFLKQHSPRYNEQLSSSKRKIAYNDWNDVDPIVAREVVLKFLYPRLDIEVSKKVNHLLKSPFVIHPKTGKICVPIPLSELSTFNPNNVPTLDTLLKEYAAHVSSLNTNSITDRHTIVPKLGVGDIKPGPYVTSLKPYIIYFNQHVAHIIDVHAKKAQHHDDLLDMF